MVNKIAVMFSNVIFVNACLATVIHPHIVSSSGSWQIGLFAAGGGLVLLASFFLRGVVQRRLKSKSGYTAIDVPYYDVDSLDYGFNSAGKGGGGTHNGPRLYPERWLMLFLYRYQANNGTHVVQPFLVPYKTLAP